MKNLAKAILSVMEEVKGIEKNMTVGSGSNSYNGVSDKDVKTIIGGAMQKHGLSIIPISVSPKTEITKWEENTQYGVKQKQSVFVEVSCKYLLLHESGESVEVAGYGNGVDPQDKAAGKATTYSLKYTLLYLFLVPTGKIDDADRTHSDDIPAPDYTLWSDAINALNTIAELTGFYNQNKDAIEKNIVIKKMLTTRKKTLS